MYYALSFIGGIVAEAIAAYLFKRYKINSLLQRDIAYLEAKAAALKKLL